MDKINTITVNGVTYEVGGSGEGVGLGDVYYIPTEICKLESGAPKSEVDTALGGNGDGAKIIELYDAVMAGKLILLKNGTTGALTPVTIVGETNAGMYVQFFYVHENTTPVFYNISVAKIATILSITFAKYKITGEKI